MILYYFARPDQMVDHEFKDDVALCRAWTHKQAIKKFSKYYGNIRPHEVHRIGYMQRVVVLTSY